MIYDPRDFSSRRYLVLLASKPQGSRDHGRVWTHRDESFVLTDEGKILTVTSIVDWLLAVGLIETGPVRSLGGRFLVPTDEGHKRLDEVLRPAVTA